MSADTAAGSDATAAMTRNVAIYPWHHFCMNLLFWQATWFLYFQNELSASEAILLYAVYDISVTVVEVPSGYLSDRVGRRFTLVVSALALMAGVGLLTVGGSFAVFAAGQALLGTAMAFNSGTDTSLLYQSLVATGRADEMERQTLRAWRFSFTALAASAVLGGALALVSHRLPFALSVLAAGVVVVLALRFSEPPRTRHVSDAAEVERMRHLATRFRNPVILWLFVVSVLMYGYSHLPFVFGQPFMAQTLDAIDLGAQTPLVSGLVTTLMMLTSVAVSLLAPALRTRLGLGALLLLAFALQIGLAGALAVSGSALAIAWLLLRMVPDSISTPFIVARLQPLLGDDSRATFLSLKSLCGKLLFAGSLWIAAGSTSAAGLMPLADVQTILGWYTGAGLLGLAALWLAARRLTLDARPADEAAQS